MKIYVSIKLLMLQNFLSHGSVEFYSWIGLTMVGYAPKVLSTIFIMILKKQVFVEQRLRYTT